jgi:hypothetical protein
LPSLRNLSINTSLSYPSSKAILSIEAEIYAIPAPIALIFITYGGNMISLIP